MVLGESGEKETGQAERYIYMRVYVYICCVTRTCKGV